MQAEAMQMQAQLLSTHPQWPDLAQAAAMPVRSQRRSIRCPLSSLLVQARQHTLFLASLR